jgi:hypothetical protein
VGNYSGSYKTATNFFMLKLDPYTNQPVSLSDLVPLNTWIKPDITTHQIINGYNNVK